ncbi:hypothetical protein A3E69_03920 [Candidatus Roizmanbacteria bacterium RIFCSPHIGHO2_12_FULL_40_130]|nr:MAG: hypothetical protein A2779_02280 [Candidatus Roizmanbacteria bacterium RIFCSPHIGHO2_01_FULL_40_98]OGK28736.1 MAG: hypothetical protein A3C31_00980 [Candidatus Roizmanbacteria bacterium RIFCSPHIGHO2_02_FULL_40_53]OGK36842.1 MAG: hypothetical protein A3E69_03920 [Candidatus Roizmanbacteria bacterium RIFCSPHIGHO2_12_FULL_40_130]OGK59806.1 MAG: hypothetical protein A3H84_03415 [Candidatus Roizmanbacteria bacterium RIFCSPLOWO2_02_FULL_40_13]
MGKMGKFLIFSLRVFLALLFLAVVLGLIAIARGYRLDFTKKSLSSTGILAISSSPKAAKIYINGDLRGVTDLNVALSPGTYSVEIKKDGFTSYNEKITLKGELVETVDPILFPVTPSLSPITNLGVTRAIPVDQSDNLILFVDNEDAEKDGIYLFEAGRKTLTFFPPVKTLILKSKLPLDVDFQKTTVYFSYDYKQAIFDFELADGSLISYLLSLDAENQEPFDVTASKDTLIDAWQSERTKETQKLVEVLPKEIRKIATSSFEVVSFTPDQTKLLYKAKKDVKLPLVINPPLIAANQAPEERVIKKNNLYVYDKREDKNYHVGDEESPSFLWYIDSKRLVFNEGRHITIMLYDGQSKQVLYSGPIEKGFFTTTSDGKILILANLNPQFNKFPDVYQVGIR